MLTPALATLVFLALGTIWTGRTLVALLNLPWLRQRTPETFAASALLGCAFWVLVQGTLSHLGLTAPQAGLALAVVQAVLALAVIWLGRWRLWLPDWRQPGWRLLGGIALAATVLALIQVIRFGCHYPVSDGPTYMIHSEWLQDHGFSEPHVFDIHKTIDRDLRLYQVHHLRMGISFLLALCQAASPGWAALEVYPGALAWGVLLNVLGIFVVCRWTLRLSREAALFGAGLAAVLNNPLHFSAQNNFLPQLYGTAFLLLALALLTRMMNPRRWTLPAAVAVAISQAALVSGYSELAPILALVDLAFGCWLLVKARRCGQLPQMLRFGAAVTLCFVLASHIETVRAVRGLLYQSSWVIGASVVATPPAYGAFAMGTGQTTEKLGGWCLDGPMRFPAFVILPLLVLLFLRGLKNSLRVRQAFPLLAALAVLALLGAYFALCTDPVTGERGYSWNLFKLCKWAYPLAAALQAAGVARIALSGRTLRWGAACVMGLAAVAAVNTHWGASHDFARIFRSVVGDVSPDDYLVKVRRAVRSNPNAGVYLCSDHFWHARLFGLAVYPRPFRNTWGTGDETMTFIGPRSAAVSPLEDGDLLLNHWDQAGSFIRFDSSRPQLLTAPAVGGTHRQHGRGLWLGEKSELEFYSPRAQRLLLAFHPELSQGLPGGSRAILSVADGSGSPREYQVDAAASRVTIPLEVSQGVSRVRFGCRIEGASSAARQRENILGIYAPVIELETGKSVGRR
jgi:hypothetical protein